MAFGDALRSDGATVKLVADTGEFNSKIDAAQRNWEQSVGQMSREALKLDLAQQRLRTSLAKYGAEAASTKRATIALKDAEEAAARAADRQTTQVKQLDHAQDSAARSANRAARGMIAGSGAARGFARSIAFASTAFIGGAGFVYAIRSTISAAADAERVQAKLKVALENVNVSYAANASIIDRVIKKHADLSGLDDEDLTESFSNMLRTTKDVNEALRLNGIAADIARTKGQGLAQAQSLVARVYLGSFLGLKRLGVEFTKSTEAQDALKASGQRYTKSQMDAAKATDTLANRTKAIAALQAAFAGQAEAYGKTAAGAQDRFRVALENTQEVIGTKVLPAFTDLLNRGTDYLNEMDRTGELQRKVNTVFDDGEKVVRGLASGFRTFKSILDPIVELLGGAERAAKVFFLAFTGYKIAGALGGLANLRLALMSLGPTAAASAAEVVIAENAIGTAAVVNAGKVGILRGSLGGLGLGAGGLAGAALPLGLALGMGLGEHSAAPPMKGESDLREYPLLWQVFQKIMAGRGLTKKERDAWKVAISGNVVTKTGRTNASESQLTRGEAMLAGPATPGATGARPGEGRLGGPGGPPTKKPPPTGDGTGAGGPSLIDLQLAVAAPGNDVADLTALRNYYARQIKALKARKNLTDEQKQQLERLYGDMASAQSQLDAIAAAAEQKIADQRAKAAAKRKAQQEAIDKQYDAMVKRENERTARRRKAFHDLIAKTQKSNAAAVAKDKEKTFTQSDVRQLIHDTIAGLHGVVGDFGSNYDSGQLATQAYAQTMLLRSLDKRIAIANQGQWHPGARYAGSEIAVAGLGVGF